LPVLPAAFVLFAGGLGALPADRAIRQYVRRAWTVEQGLPHGTVRGVAQTADGYLWLATPDGLARYDGVGFHIWRNVPGDADSLPGNNIQALHIDARDRIWIATEAGGLSVLDAQRRHFRHYRMADAPRIGSDDTWAIASRDGAVWFGTYGGGLHRLDRDGRITRYMPDDADPRSLPADTVLKAGASSAVGPGAAALPSSSAGERPGVGSWSVSPPAGAATRRCSSTPAGEPRVGRSWARPSAARTYGVVPLAAMPTTTSFPPTRRSSMALTPAFTSSSAPSTERTRAVAPPAITAITISGGVPNVGGHSAASSTPRRPLVPAPT
jgi:hypothetical protein